MNLQRMIALFMDYCLSKQLRPKTIQSYEQTLKLFARWLEEEMEIDEVEDVKEPHIRSYIVDLQKRGKCTFCVDDKHEFRKYAQQWFEVFSKPNVELVTATTYERQLRVHIYPILGDLPIEDICPVDVQKVFNAMSSAKETKIKVKSILNMIFEQAIEDGLIQRNPLHSRSIRITGKSSNPLSLTL